MRNYNCSSKDSVMYYRPRLANGDPAPLPLTLAVFRACNHIVWPLEDGISQAKVYLDRFLIFLGFLIFGFHFEVDVHYVLAYRHDLDTMLSGVPTLVSITELYIRAFQLASQKSSLKRLLKQFYAQFYLPVDEDPILFKRIHRQLLFTRINMGIFMMTFINFSLVLVQNIIHQRREMMYKQIYLFDNTRLYFYIPLLCCNAWVGVIVASELFGELAMLGELMMHLNARYTQLGKQLEGKSRQLLAKGNGAHMAAEYREALLLALRRNVQLNKFMGKMEAQFTFRIFILFAFSATLLCALGFKVATNPLANTPYIAWFSAKFFELLALGMLGSILYKTTDDLGLMYYSSGWEQVVYHSTNTKENVRLMKLLMLATQINSRPFYLTGLKYFHVTLVAVVKIIQGAFSYFTFLKSMR